MKPTKRTILDFFKSKSHNDSDCDDSNETDASETTSKAKQMKICPSTCELNIASTSQHQHPQNVQVRSYSSIQIF